LSQAVTEAKNNYPVQRRIAADLVCFTEEKPLTLPRKTSGSNCGHLSANAGHFEHKCDNDIHITDSYTVICLLTNKFVNFVIVIN